MIYRPPPLADVWLDEPGRRERRQQLGRQRQRQEQRIREKNNSVPEQPIIPLNEKDVPPLFGAPISDDDSSDDDSFVEHPYAESEGDFNKDEAPAAPPSPQPPEASNIAPEGARVLAPEGAPSNACSRGSSRSNSRGR